MTAQQAFEIMMAGRAVMVTPEFRKEIKNQFGRFSMTSVWFYIHAVHSDSTITICGSNHEMFEGYEPKIIRDVP